ncbi:MAG: hypothetical protein OSB09_07555 [Planctomycetota bacterium]|nr:hypothetical protein [Planctomycetota bacterium]
MHQTWTRLLAGELDPLLLAARSVEPGRLSQLTSLRRHGTPDEVSVVLSLWAARRRTVGRLDHGDRLWLTAEALQQATRSAVARHKAARIREICGESPVIDLCCGIGSDSMALSHGGPVVMVDRDRFRLTLARANVDLTGGDGWAVEAEAGALPLPPLPLHIDPDRRRDGRRRHSYPEMLPGPEVLEPLMERHPDLALKCGPGVDIDQLPAGEVEFIQESGDLVEATLWRGSFDGGVRRRATLLPSGESISGDQEVLDIYPDSNPAWIHEPVSVIERAGLVAQLYSRHAIGELYPGLGWLAGPQRIDSPWLKSYEVVERMPWREEKVRRWLRSKGEGISVVKTRGVSENPAQLARKFRGRGGHLILALLRHGKKQVAWILRAPGEER